jgi:transcriptional regulator with XRE-family HTH domain
MELGDKIRELRRKKGLSQVGLAKHTGLTKDRIGQLERGDAKQYRLKEISVLAEFFDVPISYFN